MHHSQLLLIVTKFHVYKQCLFDELGDRKQRNIKTNTFVAKCIMTQETLTVKKHTLGKRLVESRAHLWKLVWPDGAGLFGLQAT